MLNHKEVINVEVSISTAYSNGTGHVEAEKQAEEVANELASGLLGIKYDAFSCTTTQPVVK